MGYVFGSAKYQANEAEKGYKTQLQQRELQRLEDERLGKIAQGQSAAKLASKYLSEWNASIKDLKGYYNQAIDGVNKSFGYLDEGNEWVEGDLRNLIGEIDSSLAEYRRVYNPLRDESVAAAREGIAAERELTGVITGLAKPDYEGASGRAKADVSAEMERARQAEAREQQGLGISPTSGNYMERMRRNRVNEAINKVLAGNFARLGEQKRVSDTAIQGMEAIRPETNYAGATGISMNELEYLKEKGNQIATGINAKNQFAQTGASLSNAITNVANSYGENISKPYGEMYAANQGLSMSLNPLNRKVKKNGIGYYVD